MTQAAETAPARIASDTQLVAGVSAAHFVSHYYIIILPPLFAFVRGGLWRQLYRARPRPHRIQCRHRAWPDAGRLSWSTGSVARVLLISGLLLGAARLCARRARQFVLVVRRDVRARRPRQHGLSPGRLRDAVASCAGRADQPRFFDPHLRGHARLDRGAGQPSADAEPMGLARRLHRRGAAWHRRGDVAGHPRRAGAARRGQTKKRRERTGRLAVCWSARRSCSICSCSRCSRW